MDDIIITVLLLTLIIGGIPVVGAMLIYVLLIIDWIRRHK